MRAGGTGKPEGASRRGRSSTVGGRGVASRVGTRGMLPWSRLTDQSIARGPNMLRAAAIQLTATADKAPNLETADRLVRAAAADGATLVVLPEKWSVLGSPADLRAGAEPLDGPALAWAR